MPELRIGVIDPSQSEKTNMEVPGDVAVGKLIEALVEAMRLPVAGPEGYANRYQLHRREADGRLVALHEDQTLAENGVLEGSVLQLTIESSAAGSHFRKNDLTVFLSWSGDRSKRVAQLLKKWLPLLSNRIKPWISSEGIFAGSRWVLELSKQLEATDACILCLTSDNLLAPWLHFEAGAASKKLGRAFVCPYLLDAAQSELPGPLGQFQACEATEDGTLKMIVALNEALGQDRPYEQIQTLFEALWPGLNKSLSDIRAINADEANYVRSERNLLEDLTNKVSALSRNVDLIAGRLQQLAPVASSEHPQADVAATVSELDSVIGPIRVLDKSPTNTNENTKTEDDSKFLRDFVQRAGE